MPYTYAQCQTFAAKDKRGEQAPADWRKHCRGVKDSEEKQIAKRKKNASRRNRYSKRR